MTLELVVPEAEGKEQSVKDYVFTVLAESEPKTLTQLQRELKRHYKKSVSFQAILKAVRALLASRVLIREKKIYTLNKDWIFETRQYLDRLYTDHFKVAKPLKKVEVGKEISVYTVTNLLELDRLWNNLLTSWARAEGNDKRNVWSGKHCWWLIPRLQEEDLLHDVLSRQNIETYNVIGEKTLLDKIALTYYKSKIGHAKISSKFSNSKDIHISAFGEFLLKFEIPEEISKRLDKIYDTTKSDEKLNLKEVLDIFKENSEIEVTVMKDRMLADKIKEDIIGQFKQKKSL